MLTAAQESNLTSAGDCFEHWHSQDRAVVHSDIGQLQRLGIITEVTSSGDIKLPQDVLLCDTTASSLTISLPVAPKGTEIEIVKTASPNVLTIQPTSPDLIYGQSSVLVYNIGTALRFKSIQGGWILV